MVDPSCVCVRPVETGRSKTQTYTTYKCLKCNPPKNWPKHVKEECYCFACVSHNYYTIVLSNHKKEVTQ